MKWHAAPAHSLSDEACIARYKVEHDPAMPGILFDRYIELIFGVCQKYLKNASASEDATMEIYEILHQKLRTHQIESFRSWLYVVTKNHCLQLLRKRDPVILTEDYGENGMHSESMLHPEDALETIAGQEALKSCMESLPDMQRKSVEMFYYESKSYQEIADLLQHDKEQIRSFLQNGRRNLRLCIEQKKDSVKENLPTK